LKRTVKERNMLADKTVDRLIVKGLPFGDAIFLGGSGNFDIDRLIAKVGQGRIYPGFNVNEGHLDTIFEGWSEENEEAYEEAALEVCRLPLDLPGGRFMMAAQLGRSDYWAFIDPDNYDDALFAGWLDSEPEAERIMSRRASVLERIAGY
jgi:hypothetical protein